MHGKESWEVHDERLWSNFRGLVHRQLFPFPLH